MQYCMQYGMQTARNRALNRAAPCAHVKRSFLHPRMIESIRKNASSVAHSSCLHGALHVWPVNHESVRRWREIMNVNGQRNPDAICCKCNLYVRLYGYNFDLYLGTSRSVLQPCNTYFCFEFSSRARQATCDMIRHKWKCTHTHATPQLSDNEQGLVLALASR